MHCWQCTLPSISISFTYERVNTNPVYAACLNPTWEYTCTELWCWPIRIIGCADWGASNGPDPWGMSALAGWSCATSRSDTTPIYAACRTPSYEYYCSELGGCYPLYVNGCADFGASNSPDSWGYSTLLGHAYTSEVPGTLPLYSACLQGSGGTCSQWALQNSPDSMGMSTLLGHAYRGPVDRYRVISRTASDGRGGSISTTFTYWGLGLSSDGTEFRGHAVARVTDAAGNYTDTWFKQDDALKGRAYQAETRPAAGALLAKTVQTWTVVNPYPSTPSVTLALLAQTDAYACDGGPSCRQSQSVFTYDSHGNPTRTNHLGDVAVSGDERDERSDWVVDTVNWLRRPSRVAVHDGSGALLREAWISYDGLGWNSLGTRGLATRIESRLAGPLGTSGNPAVTHAYDAYGNRTSATDARGCTTSTTYDSSKTHLATITNCLGQVTNLEYDARWGAITSATDPNAQTTTSTYDVFGRLIKLTAPLDTGSTYGTVSYSYLDLGNPSAQRVQTSRTEQHGSANVLWSDRYLDGLGRTYLTRREGPGGQVILSDVTFDNRGLVSAVAAPHFSTEPPVWTQFTYDSLGRLTSTRHPDNATATAAYSPGQVTLTDERGSVRRRFLDVWGRLTRVEEVNGADTAATTYTYDATGGLGRVTNHLGHQTTMTYDLLGRKVAMQDPNVGNLSYSYDLGGNLVSQTDAKGQTLTFTYDLLGRVLTKHYPGGAEILWTYDDPAVPYSKGRTTRVADLATISSFTYDPIARVTQVSRLLDGSTYTLGLVYDALGRVTSKTFPDGETVTYTFNDAGWLSAIPGYLSGITYNARGQQTQLQFANAVTSTRSYSSSRFWLETIATSAPGASHQNLAFTHDPAGNITQITDAVWTGSRTFSYDALNRLLSASGPFGTSSGGIPTQTSETYLYDAIGNILQKAGIGYTYADPSHRAAVTSTSDGRAYTYDANGNMLSGAGRTLSWDPDNRLASVTMQAGGTSTFAYDHTGTRVRKTTESGVMRYPFAGYEVDHTGFITKHILAGDERVAVKRADGQTLFYHSDHLGGVSVITNQSGERVQLVEYDPWGKVTRQDGSADLTHRFTGEDFDPETGLLYFGGRYYDPALARFTIPDPYIPRPSDPQAFNRYAYARNNPVNRIDPSGYEDADADDGESSSPTGPEDSPTVDPHNFSLGVPLGLIGPEFSLRGLTITYYAGSPAAEAPAAGPSPALAGAAVGPAPSGPATSNDAGPGDPEGGRIAVAGILGNIARVAPHPALKAAIVGAAIGMALADMASRSGGDSSGRSGFFGGESTPADPNDPGNQGTRGSPGTPTGLRVNRPDPEQIKHVLENRLHNLDSLRAKLGDEGLINRALNAVQGAPRSAFINLPTSGPRGLGQAVQLNANIEGVRVSIRGFISNDNAFSLRTMFSP